MNKNILKNTKISIALISFFYIPQLITKAHAASNSCSLWIDNYNDAQGFMLGTAVDCVAGNVFKVASTVTVALAIIFTLYMIFKTVTSQGNAKAMETLPTKWKYTMILVIAAGGGGAIISIALKFLGFPSFGEMWAATWQPLIDLLNGGGIK